MAFHELRIKQIIFFAAIFQFSCISALPKIELVGPKPEIIEELAAYSPGKPNSISNETDVVMPPLRGFAEFGGIVAKTENSKDKSMPVCGPSPRTNTLNCYDMNRLGAFIGSFPVPGKVSSTPVYVEDSWLIGTSKGFLLRVKADASNQLLPELYKDNSNLWGMYSRKMMMSFRPHPVYTEDNFTQITPAQYTDPYVTQNVKWIFSASSSFIGRPIVRNGFVYIFAASQYFQAFNWETGKLVWAIRLAPDTTLKMNSEAFAMSDNEILVGNNLGSILVLNPADGSILWTWQVPSADETQRVQTSLPAGPDKFYGIIAAPLLLNREVIVSNAESMTQKISLDSHSLIWSYPVGSVAQAKSYKDTILLGSNNGRVISLNKENGAPVWSTNVTDSSPIVSLYLTKNNVLLAATRRGQIFMLNPENGQILAKNFPIGEVNGEFFSGVGKAEACLSFAGNGFRCFRAKL